MKEPWIWEGWGVHLWPRVCKKKKMPKTGVLCVNTCQGRHPRGYSSNSPTVVSKCPGSQTPELLPREPHASQEAGKEMRCRRGAGWEPPGASWHLTFICVPFFFYCQAIRAQNGKHRSNGMKEEDGDVTGNDEELKVRTRTGGTTMSALLIFFFFFLSFVINRADMENFLNMSWSAWRPLKKTKPSCLPSTWTRSVPWWWWRRLGL